MIQSSWLQECFAQGSSPESPAPRSREPCDLATGPPLTNKRGITVRDPLLLMIMIMIAAAAAPSACMAVQREHNIGQGGGGGHKGKACACQWRRVIAACEKGERDTDKRKCLLTHTHTRKGFFGAVFFSFATHMNRSNQINPRKQTAANSHRI